MKLSKIFGSFIFLYYICIVKINQKKNLKMTSRSTINIIITILIWLCIPIIIISENDMLDLFIIGFQIGMVLMQIILNLINKE